MANEKVFVRIKLNKTAGRYEVESSHPLPYARTISAYLPTEKKRNDARAYVGGTWTLDPAIRECIHLGITVAEWVEAATLCLAKTLEAGDSAEMELIAATEGGYLSVGNLLFRVHAVDYLVGGQKALPVLRRKVIDSAKAEGKRLIGDAQVRVVEILNEGDRKYRARMAEADAVKIKMDEVKKKLALVAPSWLPDTGYFLRVHRGKQQVGFLDYIYLSRWTHCSGGKRYVWECNPESNSFPLLIWIPYNPPDGRWTPSEVCTSAYTPHTTPEKSCLKLGSVPKLDGADNAYRALGAVKMLLSEVNLDSPLSALSDWNEGIRAQIPKPLLKAIVDDGNNHSLGWIAQSILSTADHVEDVLDHKAVVFGAEAEFTTPETAATLEARPATIRPGQVVDVRDDGRF